MKYISASEIKTFMKSKQEWFDYYVLWIKKEIKHISIPIWLAFHKYMETENINDAISILYNSWYDQKECFTLFMNLFDNAKSINIYNIESKELYMKSIKNNIPFHWFCDCITTNSIVDYKTVNKFTKEIDWIPPRSTITTREEYMIQWMIYLLLSWKSYAIFIEISKIKWYWINYIVFSREELFSKIYNKYYVVCKQILFLHSISNKNLTIKPTETTVT